MKNLSKNNDIIISKPDKGRGVVLVDKAKYIESMTNIIEKNEKFEVIE